MAKLWGPHKVFVHQTKTEAEDHLRRLRLAYLNASKPTPDTILMDRLSQVGEHVRLYKCEIGGESGSELELFSA